MKLEFLDDISEGGRFSHVVSDQLVRLYDFDAAQAAKLKASITEILLEENKVLDLSSLDFIESMNCNLIFTISEKDEGLNTQDKKNFLCCLTPSLYQQMLLLIDPFCEEGIVGYQWLYDLECPIDLLFSPGGSW